MSAWLITTPRTVHYKVVLYEQLTADRITKVASLRMAKIAESAPAFVRREAPFLICHKHSVVSAASIRDPAIIAAAVRSSITATAPVHNMSSELAEQ